MWGAVVPPPQSLRTYLDLLNTAEFKVQSVEDLKKEWAGDAQATAWNVPRATEGGATGVDARRR